jgi:putative flippase GtrA
MKQLLTFLMVGSAGFAVDVGVLTAILDWTRADPYSARIVAIGLALMVTWQLNRHFTFGRSDSHAAVEGLRYGSVGIAGNVLNFGVYSAILMAFPRTAPVVALIAGSASGTLFAYTGYSRLVFKR